MSTTQFWGKNCIRVYSIHRAETLVVYTGQLDFHRTGASPEGPGALPEEPGAGACQGYWEQGCQGPLGRTFKHGHVTSALFSLGFHSPLVSFTVDREILLLSQSMDSWTGRLLFLLELIARQTVAHTTDAPASPSLPPSLPPACSSSSSSSVLRYWNGLPDQLKLALYVSLLVCLRR